MFTCFPFISVKVISVKILHLMNRSSFIIAADTYLLELSISLHVTNSHYVQALSDSIHVFFPKHFSFFCSTFFISASLFLCVFEIWACFFFFVSFYIFISRVCVVYWWRPIYDLSVYTVHNIYTCSFHMYRNIIANIWLAVYYFLYWFWWNVSMIYLETK